MLGSRLDVCLSCSGIRGELGRRWSAVGLESRQTGQDEIFSFYFCPPFDRPCNNRYFSGFHTEFT